MGQYPAHSGPLTWKDAMYLRVFLMATSYRQLLVHLDSSKRSSVRLALARRLAEQEGAELTALYAVTPTLVTLPFPPMSSDLAASVLDLDVDRRARARADFDRVMEEPGANVNWAEVEELSTIAAFSQQSLYADLLVMAQHEPGNVQPGDLPADFPQAVMATSGKPALLVPYVDPQATLGNTVVIAWKETRESARAVAAAMPLLKRAAEVHVVTWGSEGSRVRGSRLDLSGYLRLHGVKSTWHEQGSEPDDLGDILLSRAFDFGADLLVMGCYGHSRAREWVLGGTSRTVLRSMTLPVLMAH
jgi:nucleotide-binding universal stress UspA family protein